MKKPKVAVCPLPEPAVIFRSMDPELPPAVAELLAKDPERFSRRLSHEEWKFLVYGDDGGEGCPFENETAAAAMWAVHRRLLMASYLGSGRRPVAWHVLEHPELPWRGPERERSTLFEANLLEPAERDGLTTEWKRAFDEAADLDEVARRKAYSEADVPRSLIRQWTRERRRRPAA